MNSIRPSSHPPLCHFKEFFIEILSLRTGTSTSCSPRVWVQCVTMVRRARARTAVGSRTFARRPHRACTCSSTTSWALCGHDFHSVGYQPTESYLQLYPLCVHRHRWITYFCMCGYFCSFLFCVRPIFLATGKFCLVSESFCCQIRCILSPQVSPRLESHSVTRSGRVTSCFGRGSLTSGSCSTFVTRTPPLTSSGTGCSTAWIGCGRLD